MFEDNARSLALRNFVRSVLARFYEDRCFLVASSLTFTTLLALVPLAMLALTVLSMTPGFTGIAARFDGMLAAHVLPEMLGRAVTRYFEQIAPQARRLTLFGVSGLAVTALLTMYTIERAFNEIWRVPRRAPTVRRLVMYWAVLTLGPILIGASLTITSYVVTLSLGLVGGVPQVAGVLTRLAPGVLTVAAFMLIYLLVPGRRVAWRHALVGGVVAGVLFELAKRAFALYVAGMSTYATVYGTFAAVPVFLLWVYVSWTVTIMGAVVAAMLPDYGRMHFARARRPGVGFIEALAVLKVLAGAHQHGEVRELSAIAVEAGLPRQRCEELLLVMATRQWTGRLASERWALVSDPSLIRLAAVYRQFVSSPEELAGLAGDARVSDALGRLGLGIDAALQLSLRDLLAGPAPA